MPLSRWQPPVLRHDAEDAEQVTWLELFFDLVFVASLIQLGNALSDDVTWAGGARFTLVFFVLWRNWAGTTSFLNRFAVDDWQHRLLVVGQMFAVGNLAIQTPGAFDERSAEFALSYVAARLLLVAMYARVRVQVPGVRSSATTYVLSFGAGALLWLVSVLLPTDVRPVVWLLAVGVELAGPLWLFRQGRQEGDDRGFTVHLEHLQERFALFTIIVLGEGFVKAIDELAETGVSLTTQVYGLAGTAITVALWWTYFDDLADARLTRDADGRPRVVAWLYLHLPLTGAITAFGVSLKKLVEQPSFADPLTTSYGVLLVVSVGVALLAAAGLDLVTASRHFAVDARHRVVPRLLAVGALAVAWLVLRDGPALLLVLTVVVIAVAQILVEVLVAVRADRWVQGRVAEQLQSESAPCGHLEGLPRLTAERLACEACEEEGVAWVELRLCLTCGHVGCCDDSEGRHATDHFDRTGHPVIRTLEPSDHWAWCYRDECSADDWRDHAAVAAHG